MKIPLIEWIWMANAAFLVCVLFLGAGIIIFQWAREGQDLQKARALRRVRARLRSMASGKPDAACQEWMGYFRQSDPDALVRIIQGKDAAVPEDAQTQIRECLKVSKDLPKIERTALRSWSRWRRIESILILSHAQPAWAIRIFQKTLRHRDPNVCYFSMLALGQLRSAEAARTLLDFIALRRISGQKIASILERFPKTISPEIIRAVESRDPLTRYWTVRLAARLGLASLSPRLESLMTDPDANIRAASCEFARELAVREAAPYLRARLKDEIWYVRLHAVRALAAVEGASCVSEILPLFRDKAPAVRACVKEAVMPYLEKDWRALIPYLGDAEEGVRLGSVTAFVESGRAARVIQDAASGKTAGAEESGRILALLVRSKMFFGLADTLKDLEAVSRERVLAVVDKEDAQLGRAVRGALMPKPEKR